MEPQLTLMRVSQHACSSTIAAALPLALNFKPI